MKVGAGTLTLTGQSAYTGSTSIQNGILQLGISDALPDPTGAPGLTVATNLTLTGGALDTNGFSQTLNTVTNQGGSMLIRSGSTVTAKGAYTQSAGTTRVDGALNVTPGLDLKLSGGQLVGSGSIGNATGSGTITVTNSGSMVRPGDVLSGGTTGTLAINGNYTQTSNGKLEIDLGGTTQGTTYDLLAVGHTASLAGTLDVKLLNGFSPTVGEQFNILTYKTLSGGFDSVVGLDSGFNYSFTSSNGVGMLMVTSAAVPEASTLCSVALMLGVGRLLVWRSSRAGRAA